MTMTEQEYQNVMAGYGFSYQTKTYQNGRPKQLYFCSAPVHTADGKEASYTCMIDMETGFFKLSYQVPTTINRLVTPECSKITDEDHFWKIAKKFERSVIVLLEAFGEEI